MENLKKEVKLVKTLSRESKKEYFKLYVDFGYRQQIITCKPVEIVAILDCPMSTLYELCKNLDESQIVAYLDFNVE